MPKSMLGNLSTSSSHVLTTICRLRSKPPRRRQFVQKTPWGFGSQPSQNTLRPGNNHILSGKWIGDDAFAGRNSMAYVNFIPKSRASII